MDNRYKHTYIGNVKKLIYCTQLYYATQDLVTLVANFAISISLIVYNC